MKYDFESFAPLEDLAKSGDADAMRLVVCKRLSDLDSIGPYVNSRENDSGWWWLDEAYEFKGSTPALRGALSDAAYDLFPKVVDRAWWKGDEERRTHSNFVALMETTPLPVISRVGHRTYFNFAASPLGKHIEGVAEQFLHVMKKSELTGGERYVRSEVLSVLDAHKYPLQYAALLNEREVLGQKYMPQLFGVAERRSGLDKAVCDFFPGVLKGYKSDDRFNGYLLQLRSKHTKEELAPLARQLGWNEALIDAGLSLDPGTSLDHWFSAQSAFNDLTKQYGIPRRS